MHLNDNSPIMEILEYIKSQSNLVEEAIHHKQGLLHFNKIQILINTVLALVLILSFAICSFIIYLVTQNLIHKESDKITIMSVFGASQKFIISQYLKNFMFYFLINIFITSIIVFGSYQIILFFINKFSHTNSIFY